MAASIGGSSSARAAAGDAEGRTQGQGRVQVPTNDAAAAGAVRHPQLAAKALDQIPDLPAGQGLGCVQPARAVRARAFAGGAVVSAPSELPPGEGAEAFFSCSRISAPAT